MSLGREADCPAVPCSARRVILVVRVELGVAIRYDRRETYGERLGRCVRERRERTSPKQKREWPQRTPHAPPKPPQLLTMNDTENALYSQLNALL